MISYYRFSMCFILLFLSVYLIIAFRCPCDWPYANSLVTENLIGVNSIVKERKLKWLCKASFFPIVI
jgi:hypothetical protein